MTRFSSFLGTGIWVLAASILGGASVASAGMIAVADTSVFPTAATRDALSKAFDLTKPIKVGNDTSITTDLGDGGKLLSQVFPGTGDNGALFAYVYQIVTPKENRDKGMILKVDFAGGAQTASIAKEKVVNVYVNQGVTDKTPLGIFGQGDAAPFAFMYGDAQISWKYLTGVKVETGYPVVAFSKNGPAKDKVELVIGAAGGDKIRRVGAGQQS